jgi:hypothetical protein
MLRSPNGARPSAISRPTLSRYTVHGAEATGPGFEITETARNPGRTRTIGWGNQDSPKRGGHYPPGHGALGASRSLGTSTHQTGNPRGPGEWGGTSRISNECHEGGNRGTRTVVVATAMGNLGACFVTGKGQSVGNLCHSAMRPSSAGSGLTNHNVLADAQRGLSVGSPHQQRRHADSPNEQNPLQCKGV